MNALKLHQMAVAVACLAWTMARAAEFDCMIEPKRVVSITGPVEALIAGVRVDRGDLVNRGDVLVEFDAGVERASAELAKARALMTSSVAARQARYDHRGWWRLSRIAGAGADAPAGPISGLSIIVEL